jgi:hypothetical protein
MQLLGGTGWEVELRGVKTKPGRERIERVGIINELDFAFFTLGHKVFFADLD